MRELDEQEVRQLLKLMAWGALPADNACEFSRGMVGSAGTCQPAAAARRSQAREARRRARPAYDACGVHLRPRLGPANSPRPRAYAGGGPWAMAEEVGVRQPDDGQAGGRG